MKLNPKWQFAHMPKYFDYVAVNHRGDLASAIPLGLGLTFCAMCLTGIGFHLAVNGTEARVLYSGRNVGWKRWDEHTTEKKNKTGFLFNPGKFDFDFPDSKPPTF